MTRTRGTQFVSPNITALLYLQFSRRMSNESVRSEGTNDRATNTERVRFSRITLLRGTAISMKRSEQKLSSGVGECHQLNHGGVLNAVSLLLLLENSAVIMVRQPHGDSPQSSPFDGKRITMREELFSYGHHTSSEVAQKPWADCGSKCHPSSALHHAGLFSCAVIKPN